MALTILRAALRPDQSGVAAQLISARIGDAEMLEVFVLAIPFRSRLAGAIGVHQRAGSKESSADDSVATGLAVRGSAAAQLGIGRCRAWGRKEDGDQDGGGRFHRRSPLNRFLCPIPL